MIQNLAQINTSWKTLLARMDLVTGDLRVLGKADADRVLTNPQHRGFDNDGCGLVVFW